MGYIYIVHIKQIKVNATLQLSVKITHYQAVRLVKPLRFQQKFVLFSWQQCY